MVEYEDAVQIDIQTFRLRWTSDEPTPVPFRVFREGTQISAFNSPDGAGQIDLAIGPGESPFVEVLDKPNAMPSIAFPGRLTLQWLAVAGAASYRIEELVDSEWSALQAIPDNGLGSFTFPTRWLEDGVVHSYRIVPANAAGNDGDSLEVSALMVRHPNAPAVNYTYNGAETPTVTIA